MGVRLEVKSSWQDNLVTQNVDFVQIFFLRYFRLSAVLMQTLKKSQFKCQSKELSKIMKDIYLGTTAFDGNAYAIVNYGYIQ